LDWNLHLGQEEGQGRKLKGNEKSSLSPFPVAGTKREHMKEDKMVLISQISPKARIAGNVRIGNYCTIHENVEIKSNTVIEDYCTIGYPTSLAEGKPLIIGKNSLIRSYSLFYEGSVFGNKLVTGHRVTVRERTIAGENLQIGTLCDIQGHCEIGDYVRFHSNVHIGQKSKIGNFVWIFPYVLLTNDLHPPSDGFIIGPEICDYAVISASSCILPGIKIGRHSLVGAGSLVTKDVGDGCVVAGVPAKYRCKIEDIKMRNNEKTPAYPWPKHFHRGYPDHIVEKWLKDEF
jgi:acetyltransferase-like isoleucine patch superfamily enzyme